MKTYRAVIIGCGRIGSTFDDDPLREKVASHAGAYMAVPGVELVAAADVDDLRLTAFRERWGVESLFKDYQEMLAKVEADIVSVCTWPQTHYQIVLDSVAAGVKAIFCEKPIATSLAEASEMVRLSDSAKVVLAVNHSRRWDSFHQEVRAGLDRGDIGEIQQVSCYYTAGLENTGTHMLDLLRYFFGDAKQVWAREKTSNTQEDSNIDGYIDFASGVTATLQSLDVKNYLIFDLDIYGTAGRIRLTNSGAKALTWDVTGSGMYSGYKELETSSPLKQAELSKSPLVGAVENIAECIQKGNQPISSGEDGRKALELIFALRESARSGLPVTLPYKKRVTKTLSPGRKES